MVEDQSFIAYTIMVQRTDGKWIFLVKHEEVDFIFPGTTINKKHTGLASAIQEMKRSLNLNFDKVELAELTNAVTSTDRIPLFVFKYNCGTEDPADLLLPHTNLKWQVSDDFKETIQKYEISGVPLF
jgi:hypothetical protein